MAGPRLAPSWSGGGPLGGGGGVASFTLAAWGGSLMQEQALGCGLPSLPHHEAELPDCPVPRRSGLSTATRPHRIAGGRKIPSAWGVGGSGRSPKVDGAGAKFSHCLLVCNVVSE